MVAVTIDLPEWVYEFFIEMYNMNSRLSDEPITFEEFLKHSITSMVNEFIPEANEGY
ncbi:MAG: hypothetical protein JSV20_00390 [Candidatus Bathyarchaeota archaeon]|nr:MAG: hypothetical protein JSV20_00390 [Candidatus Bathyarchaeota archaeon]